MSNSMSLSEHTGNANIGNTGVEWGANKNVRKQNSSSLVSPQSLPTLLRGIGTVTLLASVSIYLLQGWGSVSDLTRYLLLLGHTMGLAAVGVICSRWLKEQKGARLLLMLTLVFISANFAIIGGFVMSIWGQPVEGLYGAVTWVLSNTSSSIIMLASSLLILVPLTYLGFTVAARRSAKAFTLVFLLSNFLLLVPTRNEFALAGIMLSLLGFVVYTITKARSVDVTLSTREGLIARLILFVPLGIMLGRNMMHSVGEVVPLIVSVSIFVLMRQISINLAPKNFIRKIVEFFSIAPILMAATSTGALLHVQFDASEGNILLGFAAVASLMLFELSTRASSGKGFYSVLGSIVLAGSFTLSLMIFESSVSGVLCILAGLGLGVFGYVSERRVALVFGGLMTLGGAGFYVSDIFHNFDVNGWFTMAAFGVGAIVLGSYIEKQGEQIKVKISNVKQSLEAWGY